MRYWLISLFITSIAQAQLNKLQQSLNFEEVQAASFYIKSVVDPAQQNLALAEINILNGNYSEALETLTNSSHYFKTPETKGKYWLMTAVAFHKVQQFNSSDEAFNNAHQLIIKEPSLLAQYNYWKTMVLLERNQLAESARFAHYALSYYEKDSANNYIKKGKLLLWLGGIKKGQGELDSAKIFLLKSLQLFKNSPLDKNQEIIKVYNNLANVYAEEWNYGEATNYYEQSIHLNGQRVRNYNELTFSCSNLAILNSNFENQLKSEYWFGEALKWMKQAKIDPVRSALILQNYGAVLNKRFEIEKGLDAYRQALQIIDPLKQERIDIYAQILIGMAISYLQLNQSEKAEPFDTALDQVAEDLKTHWQNEYGSYLLWKVFKLQNESKFHEEMEILNQLEKSYESKERDDVWADIISHKATCLMNLHQYSESLRCHRNVYDYYIRIFPATHSNIVSTLNNIGSVFFMQGQYDSSRFYLELAKKYNLLPEVTVLPEESRFSSKIEWLVSNYYLLKLAKKAYHNGQADYETLELADGLILSALSILDSKRVELSNEGDRINLARLARDFFDEAMDFYYILSQEKSTYINKAFMISEKAKYQALQKAIGLDKLSNFTRVATTISDEEKSLNNKVAQLEYQFAQEISKNSEPSKDLLEEYEQEWTRSSARLDKLIDSIKVRLPDYYDLKFNKTTVDISTLRADCLTNAEQQIWVSYYVGDTTTYAIIINNTKASFIKLGSSQEIKKLLKALNNYATQFSPHHEEIQIISGRLYDFLLAPVKATLTKSELRAKKNGYYPR